ncbi:MAG: hypothetical protein ACI8TQ_001110 [Planctomycetota bacterium]|jgi:hypothetical protein
MNRSQIVLALFLLIAVVVPLAFFVMASSDSIPEGVKLVDGNAGAVVSAEDARLQRLIAKGQQSERVEVESQVAAEPEMQPYKGTGWYSPADSLATKLATIDVWVVNLEHQSALARWSVEVVNLESPDVRQIKLTDAHGMVRFEVQSGASYEAIVSIPGTGQLFTARADEVDDRDGMHAQLFIEVPIPTDVRFVGRVVSKTSGLPIVAADVEIESLGLSSLGPIAMVSDVDGRFEVSLPRYMRFVVSVSARGWQSEQMLLYELNHSDFDADASDGFDLLVELIAPAALSVRLRDSSGLVRPDVQVSVWRERLSEWSNSKPQFYDRPQPWIGKTNQEGVISFDGLPAQIALKVIVDELEKTGFPQSTFPEERPQEQVPMSIVLTAGERMWIELEPLQLGGIAGRVLTPDGDPVAHHGLVLLEALDDSGDWMSRGGGPQRERTRTDVDGGFQFENVPAGRWWISSPDRTSAAEPLFVDLSSSGHVTDLRIVLFSDVYTEGVVLDPSGVGVTATVIASGEKDVVYALSDFEGKFRIGPQLTGTYELYAHARAPGLFEPLNPEIELLAGSTSVSIEAGSKGVELHLQPGGILNARVVDEQGRAIEGEAILTNRHGGHGRSGGMQRTNFDDGAVRFTGLMPGDDYALFVQSEGRVAMRSQIEVTSGSETQPILLRTELGARLSVRNESGKESITYKLLQGDVVIGGGTAGPGRRETISVPTGVITVQTVVHVNEQEIVHKEQLIDCSSSELAVVLLE